MQSLKKSMPWHRRKYPFMVLLDAIIVHTGFAAIVRPKVPGNIALIRLQSYFIYLLL